MTTIFTCTKCQAKGISYCECRDPAIPVDEMVSRQRRFLEEIQPWVEEKAKIYKFVMPFVVVKADGTLEHRHSFTSEQKETIDLLDALIENARSKLLAD